MSSQEMQPHFLLNFLSSALRLMPSPARVDSDKARTCMCLSLCYGALHKRLKFCNSSVHNNDISMLSMDSLSEH